MAKDSFQDWAEDMIKYLAEDIRETKKLTRETRTLAIEAKKQTDELKIQTEQLRELVIVTRSEWQDYKEYFARPWWKKLFGLKNKN